MVYPANDTILAETSVDGENWEFTGNMEYTNGTSMFTSGSITNTTIEKKNADAAKYIFGEGWSLDKPSLDVDEQNVYVSLPNGQTYKADFSKGTGLADYELTDIVFTNDTTYGNGKDPSAYKLYYANGDSYYFSANGELLVEMDRFRNAIRYYYDDIKGLRLLTKVADSVGRTVDIQYNDTVTIFKSGSKTVRLVKSPIPGQTNKFYLSQLIDAQGRRFYYDYSFDPTGFDQVGTAATDNLYANLVEITYPTGAKTKYVWEKRAKNLVSGYMDYYRVKERKDTADNRTYNMLKYQYYNEPDGYPFYKPSNIDELYKYFTQVTDSKGIKTKYLYNSKHQNYNTQQYSNRLLSETLTWYHPKYAVPVKELEKTYNAKGNVFEKVDTYDYDHRGNVIAENHPDTLAEIKTEEHKTTYKYDYEYNLMTSKKFKQDKDTTVEIRYALTPDQKSVAAESVLGNTKLLANTAYTYDVYGNMTSEKTEKEPGEWVTTRYEYGTDYKGAYLTAVIAEGIKDADGLTKSIKTSSTYDFNTGNQITATDGNGNVTAYE